MTILEKWNECEANVLHPNAGSVQRKEMKLAFFMGAGVILAEVMRLGDDSIEEDDAVDQLEDMRTEIQDFLDTAVAEVRHAERKS